MVAKIAPDSRSDHDTDTDPDAEDVGRGLLNNGVANSSSAIFSSANLHSNPNSQAKFSTQNIPGALFKSAANGHSTWNSRIRFAVGLAVALVAVAAWVVLKSALREVCMSAGPSAVEVCPSSANAAAWRTSKFGNSSRSDRGNVDGKGQAQSIENDQRRIVLLMAFTEGIASYANYTSAINRAYAARAGLEYVEVHSSPRMPKDTKPHWLRYYAMQELFGRKKGTAGREVDAVIYLDADNVVVDHDADLRELLPAPLSKVVWHTGNEVRNYPARRNGTGGFELNSGVLAIANSAWTRAQLHRMLEAADGTCLAAHTKKVTVFGPNTNPFHDQACLDSLLAANKHGERDRMRVVVGTQSVCQSTVHDGSPIHAMAGYTSEQRDFFLRHIYSLLVGKDASTASPSSWQWPSWAEELFALVLGVPCRPWWRWTRLWVKCSFVQSSVCRALVGPAATVATADQPQVSLLDGGLHVRRGDLPAQ